MENINFILPEIFISLGIMFLLMVGVFKKNSSAIVYTLSIIVLLITLGLIVNFPSNQEALGNCESQRLPRALSMQG